MKKIAFQGRRGAYSESAAYHLFGNNIEVVPMDTFEQIFQGIETGVVDGGAIGPHLFAVHGEGGKSAWTDAELRPDGTLFVKDGGVGEVNRVEYAYSAFPPNPPLRRKDDGLPVFPFSAVIPRDNS